VADCYFTLVGMDDQEVTGYIADMLTDFTNLDLLNRLGDPKGRPRGERGQYAVG
jgi:hypothetical protein